MRMDNFTCEECRPLLPWYVTGRLSAEQRALIDAHLGTCTRCPRELEEWRVIAAAATAASQRHSPALGAQQQGWQALRARIATERASAPSAPVGASRNGVFHRRRTLDLGVFESAPTPPEAQPHPPRRPPERPSRLVGVLALAAVVVLALALVSLFSNAARRPHTPLPTVTPTTSPTQHLYFQSATAGVSALDPSSGAALWTYANAPFASQIVAAGTRVFFIGQTTAGSGELVALDAPSGRVLWQVPLTSPFGTLAATSNLVFVATNTATHTATLAFDAATGATRWQVPLGSSQIVTSMVATDQTLVELQSTGALVAFQAGNGAVSWQKANGYVTLLLEQHSLLTTTTCGSSSVVVATTYNVCLASLAVSNGAVQWTSPIGQVTCTLLVLCSGAPSGPIAAGPGVAYIVGTAPAAQLNGVSRQQQVVFAVDASSGAARWQYAIPSGIAPVNASLTYGVFGADAHAVYYCSTGGTLHALAASQPAPLWSVRLPFTLTLTSTQFVLTPTTAYVESGGHASAIRLSDGDVLWTVGQ